MSQMSSKILFHSDKTPSGVRKTRKQSSMTAYKRQEGMSPFSFFPSFSLIYLISTVESRQQATNCPRWVVLFNEACWEEDLPILIWERKMLKGELSQGLNLKGLYVDIMHLLLLICFLLFWLQGILVCFFN